MALNDVNEPAYIIFIDANLSFFIIIILNTSTFTPSGNNRDDGLFKADLLPMSSNKYVAVVQNVFLSIVGMLDVHLLTDLLQRLFPIVKRHHNENLPLIGQHGAKKPHSIFTLTE